MRQNHTKSVNFVRKVLKVKSILLICDFFFIMQRIFSLVTVLIIRLVMQIVHKEFTVFMRRHCVWGSSLSVHNRVLLTGD